MRIPEPMPAKQRDSESVRGGSSGYSGGGVEPAGCCAQACIDTPLGRVCQCVLDLPIC